MSDPNKILDKRKTLAKKVIMKPATTEESSDVQKQPSVAETLTWLMNYANFNNEELSKAKEMSTKLVALCRQTPDDFKESILKVFDAVWESQLVVADPVYAAVRRDTLQNIVMCLLHLLSTSFFSSDVFSHGVVYKVLTYLGQCSERTSRDINVETNYVALLAAMYRSMNYLSGYQQFTRDLDPFKTLILYCTAGYDREVQRNALFVIARGIANLRYKKLDVAQLTRLCSELANPQLIEECCRNVEAAGKTAAASAAAAPSFSTDPRDLLEELTKAICQLGAPDNAEALRILKENVSFDAIKRYLLEDYDHFSWNLLSVLHDDKAAILELKLELLNEAVAFLARVSETADLTMARKHADVICNVLVQIKEEDSSVQRAFDNLCAFARTIVQRASLGNLKSTDARTKLLIPITTALCTLADCCDATCIQKCLVDSGVIGDIIAALKSPSSPSRVPSEAVDLVKTYLRTLQACVFCPSSAEAALALFVESDGPQWLKKYGSTAELADNTSWLTSAVADTKEQLAKANAVKKVVERLSKPKEISNWFEALQQSADVGSSINYFPGMWMFQSPLFIRAIEAGNVYKVYISLLPEVNLSDGESPKTKTFLNIVECLAKLSSLSKKFPAIAERFVENAVFQQLVAELKRCADGYGNFLKFEQDSPKIKLAYLYLVIVKNLAEFGGPSVVALLDQLSGYHVALMYRGCGDREVRREVTALMRQLTRPSDRSTLVDSCVRDVSVLLDWFLQSENLAQGKALQTNCVLFIDFLQQSLYSSDELSCILLRVSDKLLRALEHFWKGSVEVNFEERSLFVECTTALLEQTRLLTQRSVDACKQFLESAMFKEMLIELKTPKIAVTGEIEPRYSKIAEASIVILMNVSRAFSEKASATAQKLKAIDIIERYLECKTGIKISTMILLCYLLTDNHSDVFYSVFRRRAVYDIVELTHTAARAANHCPPTVGMKLTEILESVARMANFSEQFASHLLDQHFFSVSFTRIAERLLDAAGAGKAAEKEESYAPCNADEKVAMLKCLWSCSFYPIAKAKILTCTGLLGEVEELASNAEDLDLKRTAYSLLRDLGLVKETTGSAPSAVTVTPSDSDATKVTGGTLAAAAGGHIMFSYCWKDRQQDVVQMKKYLQSKGFRTWLDLDDMGSSTVDAMADAVSGAEVIIVCFSQNYFESANCRSEAKFAHTMKIPRIYVRMGQWKYGGWLGFIMGDALWEDASDESAFQGTLKRLPELIAKIRSANANK